MMPMYCLYFQYRNFVEPSPRKTLSTPPPGLADHRTAVLLSPKCSSPLKRSPGTGRSWGPRQMLYASYRASTILDASNPSPFGTTTFFPGFSCKSRILTSNLFAFSTFFNFFLCVLNALPPLIH